MTQTDAIKAEEKTQLDTEPIQKGLVEIADAFQTMTDKEIMKSYIQRRSQEVGIKVKVMRGLTFASKQDQRVRFT